MITDEQIEQCVQQAQSLFDKGFNCAQAVFAACAQFYGIDQSLALRLAASFGGGIGRMHSVCGAASGMFIAEGLQSGSATQGDTQTKLANYDNVRQLAEAFREQHGSLICAELLGMQPVNTADGNQATLPKKTPCKQMVGNAVRIFLHKNAQNICVCS